MPIAILQCYRCGHLNEVKVRQRSESRLTGLCFNCDKSILIAEGGGIYQLEESPPKALFNLGYIRIAPMAYANLAYVDRKAFMIFHACLIRDFPDDHPHERNDEKYQASLPQTKVAFEATLACKLLLRHVAGEWGSSADVVENQRGIQDDSYAIVSIYALNRQADVWVQTDAYRASTTIMLPEER